MSTHPTMYALWHPPFYTSSYRAFVVLPFSSALPGPALWSAGPVGLLSGSSSLPLNRFLLYKHPLSLIYTFAHTTREERTPSHICSYSLGIYYTIREDRTPSRIYFYSLETYYIFYSSSHHAWSHEKNSEL